MAAILFLSAAPILADTVILKNGVILEGVVYDQNPHILRVQKEGGAALTIRKSQVIRVIYGDRVEEYEPEKKPETRRPAERKPEQKKPVAPREKKDPIVIEKEKDFTENQDPEPTIQPDIEPAEEESGIIRKPLSGPLADPLSSRYIANLDRLPEGVSKEELSRSHSLIYGEGEDSQELILRDQPHSPVIDLNRIVVGPVDPDKEGKLRIHTDDQGKPVALVEVDYSRAGLNVPQAIRDGRILEHEVLLRNHKGEILGRAPLNFSSFRFERITEQRKARRFLILPNATSVTVEVEGDDEPKTRIVAHVKNYTDRDAIPQSIELKERPDPNYPVTLQVRMTLIDPYVAPLCKECLEDPLYREARKDYEEALAKLRNLEANPEMLQDDSAEKEPARISQLAHSKADTYRKSVKDAIEKMNKQSHRIMKGKVQNHTSDGNFIQYRQWNLYSRPYFFYVSDESAHLRSEEN
tara:strand:+ start:32394 stop:33794 length:1401 start_codon:yes stop_codon:yes gene_type:complete